MAEPPAIYAHLMELEEDVTALLASGSELGRNLVAEKKALEKLGVVVNVRVRHGFIIDQLLDEMREGNYDLIVSGSSRALGPLQHYIMGDVTQRILDSAECSVLVARSRRPGPAWGLWQSFARLFR
jgi:nucleotide-binding universal stress UspA family protein